MNIFGQHWKYFFTSAIFVAQVRESPDVPKTNGVAERRQDELDLPPPSLAGGGRGRLLFLVQIPGIGLQKIIINYEK